MNPPASFRSVADLVLHRVAESAAGEALLYPVEHGWKTLTWADVGERVRAIACGLHALGLKAEQRCGIVSGTRHEWLLADLAILCAGGATTTVYPSSTAEESAFVLRDSASRFVFVENAQQIAKLAGRRDELPGVERLIVIEGAAGSDGWVITLDEVMARGRTWDAEHPGHYEGAARAVRPDSLATLIYTSGTTGRPKGVELTHDCWVYEGEAIHALGLLTPEDRQYLWLPLAHSFGKVMEAAQLRIGFPTAVDGRVERMVENLAVIKPTFVAAVPRIFEKVHNRVVESARAGGGARWAIFRWAFSVGQRVSALRQQGQRPSGLLALQNAIADRLVFTKLRERFGGRLRFFVSGSAPLSREIAEFFHAADILLLEGYGLTETSAATFVNRPDRYRFGTVGLPLPGTEVRIAEEDGEVLVRGRGSMRGYHGLPEATRETLDEDGWVHTGDIGRVLDGGFLQITDRKKDLIKTSGGKYVAPQAVEGKLKAICPWVSQVLVHGNNRNFCSALVSLDEEAIQQWAAAHDLGGRSYAELAKEPRVVALIQASVDELNAHLASYESIRKFALLPADLSIENGELTPSLKLKRKAVEAKYRALLDAFYTGAMAEV